MGKYGYHIPAVISPSIKLELVRTHSEPPLNSVVYRKKLALQPVKNDFNSH